LCVAESGRAPKARPAARAPREPADAVLFAGDTGELPMDCRRVLVHLRLGPALDAERQTKLWPVLLRDERVFDETFERWVGGGACFVYSKAGRALDDRRHKVSPYLVADEARRICIDPSENVVDKLERARAETSHSTFRGVYNHLHAVTRSYSKLVRPLKGSVPERAHAVIDDALSGSSTGLIAGPSAATAHRAVSEPPLLTRQAS